MLSVPAPLPPTTTQIKLRCRAFPLDLRSWYQYLKTRPQEPMSGNGTEWGSEALQAEQDCVGRLPAPERGTPGLVAGAEPRVGGRGGWWDGVYNELRKFAALTSLPSGLSACAFPPTATSLGWLVSSKGSPGRIQQWSDVHPGKHDCPCGTCTPSPAR